MITDHVFVGLRQWGLFPSPDKPCQRLNDFEEQCGQRLDEHESSRAQRLRETTSCIQGVLDGFFLTAFSASAEHASVLATRITETLDKEKRLS